ncbi:MAG: HD domain-containing protein [Coriobacteriales bacterium]|nr:HD domain-containing protein [Coriobacteriales bacterium]
MIDKDVLVAAEAYARDLFAGDASGHDFEHTLRVFHTVQHIAREEGADQGIVCLAALLHDVDDAKLSPDTTATLGNAHTFLERHDVKSEEAEAVLTAIREVSFSKNGGKAPSTLEAACVRDADRLDAIGAIGIARAFAFGGSRGRALHDPTGRDQATTIAHFHDKLLLLKDMMCTRAGRCLAEDRDRYLRSFLDEFMAEWDGDR